MSSFEKEYYEAESFWEGDMLQDFANRERIEVTAKLIPLEVKSIADIGCGNGVFVNFLKEGRPDLQIIGVDRSNTALRYVKTNKIIADIGSLPFDDMSFECVSCLEVIEHLPIPVFSQALSELTRISSKYIIVSVPYNENLQASYNRCPSCMSIFNHELHVRKFTDENFTQLLAGFGFECIKQEKLNVIETLVGHDLYKRIFYPEQFLAWQSPICPICGYIDDVSEKNPSNSIKLLENASAKSKWLSAFTRIPKLFWPKQRKPYWILGLFKKTDQ